MSSFRNMLFANSLRKLSLRRTEEIDPLAIIQLPDPKLRERDMVRFVLSTEEFCCRHNKALGR